MTNRLALVLIAMLTTACGVDGISGNGFAPAPGRIIMHDQTNRIQVPDTVEAGVAFDVRFLTYGSGCTPSVASTDVTLTGTLVEIRPLDNHQTGVCTQELRYMQHHAEVVMPALMPTPAEATIRVIGVNEVLGSNGTWQTVPAELSRQIVVVTRR